jgi:hypothetical protein
MLSIEECAQDQAMAYLMSFTDDLCGPKILDDDDNIKIGHSIKF